MAEDIKNIEQADENDKSVLELQELATEDGDDVEAHGSCVSTVSMVSAEH